MLFNNSITALTLWSFVISATQFLKDTLIYLLIKFFNRYTCVHAYTHNVFYLHKIQTGCGAMTFTSLCTHVSLIKTVLEETQLCLCGFKHCKMIKSRLKSYTTSSVCIYIYTHIHTHLYVDRETLCLKRQFHGKVLALFLYILCIHYVPLYGGVTKFSLGVENHRQMHPSIPSSKPTSYFRYSTS